MGCNPNENLCGIAAINNITNEVRDRRDGLVSRLGNLQTTETKEISFPAIKRTECTIILREIATRFTKYPTSEQRKSTYV